MLEVGGRGGASGGREASPPSYARNFEGLVTHVQHALLPLDEVLRIYVAFGELPAAGGLYVFFGTLGSNLVP